MPIESRGQKEGGHKAAQEEENNHNGTAFATASLPLSPDPATPERETG
jgi:hypothetical protein